MTPLLTVFDRTAAGAHGFLTPPLRRLYGGDLAFPEPDDRPYVFGNLVTTLDGVVSFKIPGQSAGGPISGFSEPDHFVMGLLRASADAVVIGAGTLRDDPGRVRVPRSIYPDLAEEFYALRRHLGKTTSEPLNVVVTRSGVIDLAEPTFRTKGVPSLIITTEQGRARLTHDWGARLEATAVRSVTSGSSPHPADILRCLWTEFHVGTVLHEGGPRLFGAFLKAELVDELLLTIAPQVAGRDGSIMRPGLVADIAFAPEEGRWAELQSVRIAGNHLFLHLSFKRYAETAALGTAQHGARGRPAPDGREHG